MNINQIVISIILFGTPSGIFGADSSIRKDPSSMLPGQLTPFEYPLPSSSAEWDQAKVDLRRTLWRLLGDLPEPFTPQPKIIRREQKAGYTLEKFQFENGVGDTVYGYIAVPEGRTQPGPAILYHHYHGGEYDNGKEEILKNYPVDRPPVESLTQEGYVVLAIDAYAFGERQHQGAAGDREKGGQIESSLFKQFIWQGKTLWGMMVRDDQLALNYLLSRPEVDPQRVGATGMSMGSTRTWWLSALDERIHAAVCVCCLTRYQNLIRHGEINQHGIYYFVPNLLKEGIDMEAVVSLIAPRPLLTLTGDRDGGSPADGVIAINTFAEKIFGLYNLKGNFQGILYPGVAHQYTPEMWKETLAWFKKHLQ